MFPNPITYTLHVPEYMKETHAQWFGETWYLTESHHPLRMIFGTKTFDAPTRITAEGEGEFLGFFFNLGNHFHCAFAGDDQPMRYFKRHQYTAVYMPDAACHYDFAAGNASAIWLHFPLYLFNLAADEYPFLRDFVTAARQERTHVVSTEAMPVPSEILRIIRTILYSNGFGPNTRDTFFYYNLANLMFKCFEQIDRLLQNPAVRVDTSYEIAKISKIKAHIQAHLADHLTLNDLAGEVGVAPRTLSRIFRKNCNETVMDFVMCSRMDKAMELLKHSAMSIERIGVAVGYRVPSHFTRAFVRKFGFPPRELRTTGSLKTP